MCKKKHEEYNGQADYISKCNEKLPFLEHAPTWYRFGVPGLGNIDENWNMFPSWRKTNDAIDIPNLRTNGNDTTNFVKCDEKDLKLNEVTALSGKKLPQWHCGPDNDKWKYMNKAERLDIISGIEGKRPSLYCS